MQFLDVFRAMVLAVRVPWRLAEYADRRALTFFAVAVLSVTACKVCAAYLTAEDPQLVAESALLAPSSSEQTQVDLQQPKRLFTAVLGGAVFTTIVSTAVLAGLMMVIGRFLTDRFYLFRHAIIVTSGAASIAIIRIVLETSLQLVTHSARWGPHLGLVIDPTGTPYLFAALQRVDLLGLWEYLVVAVGLVGTQGLHRRYGYIVGLVAWLASVVLLGGATGVASIVSGIGR